MRTGKKQRTEDDSNVERRTVQVAKGTPADVTFTGWRLGFEGGEERPKLEVAGGFHEVKGEGGFWVQGLGALRGGCPGAAKGKPASHADVVEDLQEPSRLARSLSEKRQPALFARKRDFARSRVGHLFALGAAMFGEGFLEQRLAVLAGFAVAEAVVRRGTRGYCARTVKSRRFSMRLIWKAQGCRGWI